MPKSIMIVDDSEMIRRTLRELFARDGNWVICAEAVDGRDALEKARQFHPDFVVLDLSMPYMDGLEVAPKLKTISPHSSIVMLTAFKDGFIEKEAYKAGVSWVLSKDQASKIVDFARILLGTDRSRATASQYN
jgi:DNA-binding NarL/FixJ family response regulator